MPGKQNLKKKKKKSSFLHAASDPQTAGRASVVKGSSVSLRAQSGEGYHLPSSPRRAADASCPSARQTGCACVTNTHTKGSAALLWPREPRAPGRSRAGAAVPSEGSFSEPTGNLHFRLTAWAACHKETSQARPLHSVQDPMCVLTSARSNRFLDLRERSLRLRVYLEVYRKMYFTEWRGGKDSSHS